jgi:hypothetical protein
MRLLLPAQNIQVAGSMLHPVSGETGEALPLAYLGRGDKGEATGVAIDHKLGGLQHLATAVDGAEGCACRQVLKEPASIARAWLACDH